MSPETVLTESCACWQVREYLEKHYEEKSGMEAVKLAIKALTETVEAGSKDIEVLLQLQRLPAVHAKGGVLLSASPSFLHLVILQVL